MQRNNHRRYNPLLDEWVIVAANRVNRPWQGANTDKGAEFVKSDVINPLAPGGVRGNGTVTPNFRGTYVFENDFPTFTDFETKNGNIDAAPSPGSSSLFLQQEIRGTCRVICYHPDSEKTLSTMTHPEVLEVVREWMRQFNELKDKYKWIQIFENRGAAVGCSNAHPHGQLWAGDFVPSLPRRKDACQKAHYDTTSKSLLFDYLQQEIERNERIVLRNEHWTVLVPFWAFWPYETMLLPNRRVSRMDELEEAEQVSLASILKQLVIKYDNIFKCTFPYSMGWLGSPTGPGQTPSPHWQLHASFHPPLLRSSTVPKYMAGYEVFAEPQRDITPEMAAATIRGQPDVHYSNKE